MSTRRARQQARRARRQRRRAAEATMRAWRGTPVRRPWHAVAFLVLCAVAVLLLALWPVALATAAWAVWR